MRRLMMAVAAISVAVVAGDLQASVRASRWHRLTLTLSAWLERYTGEHNGTLPPTFAEAVPRTVREDIERDTGTSFESLVLYLPAGNLHSPDSKSQIIALLSFPVQETEEGPPARYVIIRNRDGIYRADWFTEPQIRAAAQGAGVELPQAAVVPGFRQPLRDFQYAETLIEEAVRMYHVPEKEALAKVGRYMREQKSHGEPLSTSWKEVSEAVDRLPEQPAAEGSAKQIANHELVAPEERAAEIRSSRGWAIPILGLLAALVIGVGLLIGRKKRPSGEF